MSKLLDQAYQFELVDDNSNSVKYDFVSIGEIEVPKRVAIVPLEEFSEYFNIGFGNLTIDRNGREEIEDMSRDNNKQDGKRVLITVFACCLDFLSNHPNAKLTFFGNTQAKHRLYKMRINATMDLIQEFFQIKGGIFNKLEVEETESGKVFLSKIDSSTLRYEYYSKPRSNLYSFITFELKEEYK